VIEIIKPKARQDLAISRLISLVGQHPHHFFPTA
jgi:hypothetical protein